MGEVTAREVADYLGVSASTVSRALSSKGTVSAATKSRVEAAVRKLGHTPVNSNPKAADAEHGRRTRRPHRMALALVVPDLENSLFASIVRGAQSQARVAGYSLIVADSEEDEIVEKLIHEDLADTAVGLLACSPRTDTEHLQALSKRLPVVVLNRQDSLAPSLVADDENGGFQVGRHLLALGHRRVAWVGGPESSWSGARRLRGLRRAIEENADATLIEVGNFASTFQGGISAADQVLASGATAAVAFNDLIAVGVIEQARRRGVGVPADLSVAGFDNSDLAEHVWPRLTSVGMDKMRFGKVAVDLLLALVGNHQVDTGATEMLPVELFVRGSTAALSQQSPERTDTPAGLETNGGLRSGRRVSG